MIVFYVACILNALGCAFALWYISNCVVKNCISYKDNRQCILLFSAALICGFLNQVHDLVLVPNKAEFELKFMALFVWVSVLYTIESFKRTYKAEHFLEGVKKKDDC